MEPVIVYSGDQYEDDANHPNLEHVIAVSAGEGHSMALDANGYGFEGRARFFSATKGH